LDIPGATGTFAKGINSAGQIVGTFWDAGGNRHGFVTTR
jgi:probable HAF family extracellular repeat protein